MALRSIATACGLVGGLCWLARAVADHEVLLWAGFALLGVGAAAAGAGLVRRGAGPLRLFVAVAHPLLLWSVLELARDAGSDRTVDVAFGALAVVVSVGAWLRRPVSSGRHAPGRTRPVS